MTNSQIDLEAADYGRLHRDALVADMHSDTVLKARVDSTYDFCVRNDDGHMDLPRLREGGIDLQVFACWLPTKTPLDSCFGVTEELIDSFYTRIDACPDELTVCTNATEAQAAIDGGKIAAVLAIENGVAIANDLDNIEHFYNRGVRYITLTHTASSDWCISSADTAEAFHGLTDFGKDVVRKMNKLGMIVDISHASVSAVEEVLKITTAPIIASHSCVHALCTHDRNLTDDQIKDIAANGGVIGVNFFPAYVSEEYRLRSDSIWAHYGQLYDSVEQMYIDNDSALHAAERKLYHQLRDDMSKYTVSIGELVNHIEYIVNLVGADYVGLGSDFDGVPTMPEGLDDCTGVPLITKELVARGYSEVDIRKILGGNFMRVFGQVCK